MQREALTVLTVMNDLFHAIQAANYVYSEKQNFL